jgi:hypothetical protein
VISCRCFGRTFHTSHGAASRGKYTREYRAWAGAKARCTLKCYERYRGRGIIVCERWVNSFPAFLADMGICPPNMTLDRIDNNGNYEPGNCRWATRTEQQRNTCRNRRLTHDGVEMTITEWAIRLGVKANTITCRLRRGWSADKALSFQPDWQQAAHELLMGEAK